MVGQGRGLLNEAKSHTVTRPDTAGTSALSLFNLRRGEVGPVLLAGAMFFCILCGYFFIRPVRDAFGVERGMSSLYSLFVATMVASLALNPVFSWLVGRFDRKVFLPVAFGSIVLMLLGFAAWRSDAGDAEAGVWAGRIFFVWLSVMNLFMTGLFWSLMADCFDVEESRRVFPAIAVGGTLGALLGSAAAWAVSGYPFELFGRDLFDLGIELSAPQMMLVAAAFVGLAGLAATIMSTGCACARAISSSSPPTSLAPATRRPPGPERDKRGDGRIALLPVLRSRYLLFIASYIALLAVLATFLYFTQNLRLPGVLAAEESESGRVGAFASIDFWTQFATLTVQLLVTARLMRWLGVGWTLALLPVVVLAGYDAVEGAARGRRGASLVRRRDGRRDHDHPGGLPRREVRGPSTGSRDALHGPRPRREVQGEEPDRHLRLPRRRHRRRGRERGAMAPPRRSGAVRPVPPRKRMSRSRSPSRPSPS